MNHTSKINTDTKILVQSDSLKAQTDHPDENPRWGFKVKVHVKKDQNQTEQNRKQEDVP